MADNVTANAGSGGATFAADDIGGGVLCVRQKVVWGPDGTGNDADVASGKPLPVQIRDSTGVEVVPLTTTAFAALLGAKTDAKSTATDATSITFMQVMKQISASVQLWVYGAGTAAASARVTLASDDPAVATLGATSGAKVVTDATGTIQQYLRGLVVFLANALGAGTAATANRVVTATDDTIHGALTETAPTTDIASSGLNGRLQRIAQRLTSLISPGLSVAVSVTRTADTNAYAANDVLGSATGSTAGIDFNLAAISGSSILITSVAFERDVAALISGETSYNLYLYNVTPPSALGDNAAFDLPTGDRTSFLGVINLGTPVVMPSAHTLYVEQNGINKQVKLSGTHIFGYLVTVGAYTPTSAAVHKITINAVQL